ncbi:MAG: endonuclease/exonuclease/phosphatase family protein, partial [Candidatus Caldatribacteriota bacterium]
MKFLKIFISTIIGLLMIIGVVLVYFTVREYRPQDEETMTVSNHSELEIELDQEISVLTFNIGYAGLGINEDFVMDGGKKGRADSKDVVRSYLDGIKDILSTVNADIFLLQEVDKPSRRSYYINQVDELSELFSNYDKVFSYNYLADFVPFPVSFTDYMGKVASGIQTLSKYKISESIRYQTPGGFSWPVRTVNLKRAIQVNYLPIKDSDKELVIINLHLSAYDDGEMKKAETKFLAEEILKR